MKTLLSLLVVVLLCSMSVFAQRPVQDLPELQEWYSLPLTGEGVGISYLPDFDTENGGKNAIAVRTNGDPTWYNRFAYDTVSQFSWSSGGTYKVAQADFNGDGIKDYMDSHGYVYRGIANGKPPEKVPIAQPIEHIPNTQFYVGDFNGDGYEDIIMNTKGSAIATTSIFYMVLGSVDFKTIRSLWLMELKENDEYMVGAYLTADKQPRLITYRLSEQKRFEGFVLQSLDFTGGVTAGDIKVSVTALDSVGHYRSFNEQPKYKEYNSGLYVNKKDKRATLIAAHGSVSIYAIEQDKFRFVYDNERTTGTIYPFQQSIDGTGNSGWARHSWDVLFYSGNPSEDTIPKSRFLRIYKGNSVKDIVNIGDVTGDSVSDFALCYAGQGEAKYFVIAKGITPNTVKESSISSFQIHSCEPNPIGALRTAILPISVEQANMYNLTLYDGTGKLIGDLFKGVLPIGEHRLTLNLKIYSLSAGFYTLRLTDGKSSRERGILVTNP